MRDLEPQGIYEIQVLALFPIYSPEINALEKFEIMLRHHKKKNGIPSKSEGSRVKQFCTLLCSGVV